MQDKISHINVLIFFFRFLLDKSLAYVPHEKIVQQLTEVGFDSERQKQLVGGLSGGWKMRLELARAMLYNADLLLLDEVLLYP